jgi:hypothetical protein
MVEVKPNAIIIPLDAEKGLNLRLPRNGKAIIGAALQYEGLETQKKGELSFVTKPQYVPIKGIGDIIDSLNSNPGWLNELGDALADLQSGREIANS